MFSKLKKSKAHDQQQPVQQQPQYHVDPHTNQIWDFNNQTQQWVQLPPAAVNADVAKLSDKYHIPIDCLEVLRNYDIKFIVDDSGSMNHYGRMDEVKEVLEMMVLNFIL